MFVTPPILEFIDEDCYLSNFYLASFTWNRTTWGHSEGAYQASKATTLEDYNLFLDLSPGQAKRLGRKIKIRSDWEEVKRSLMYEIVLAKFSQNPDLAKKLIATGTARLEEGNLWGDKIWGICPPGSGLGQNLLGKLLMLIRSELGS